MIDELIWVLEKSVEKNGEIVLTNKHLLNIIKMVKRHLLANDFRDDFFEAMAEIEECGDK